MSIVELVKNIQDNGIKLYISDGKLRCMAPDGVISSKLLNDIKSHKHEITQLLTNITVEKQTISKRPESYGEKLPLSFAQQRLWFLDQLIPNNSFYNLPMTVRFLGHLNICALHDAFNTVVTRHESLRTEFVNDEGQPLQHILPHNNVTLPLIDLSSLPAATSEIQMQFLAATEVQTPFNLCQGPLLRIKLICMSTDHYVLLLNMHHIISDGWSMGVLTQELAGLYSAFSQNLSNPLSPLPIQYPDFAYWQRSWLQGEVLEQQLAYWRQQLYDAPTFLELPTDEVRPPIQSYCGAIHDLHISKSLTDKINQLTRSQDATLFMTLLAAFQLLLAKLCTQEDICVGTPIANRHYAELEPLIGFFVNTLVIRTHLKGNPTVGELLSQVRDTTLDAYAHQDLPFEQLVDECNAPRNMSHSPLFQVMFTLQNAPQPPLRASQLQLQPVGAADLTAKFDIELQFTETPNGLTGGWKYSSDLFHAETIEHWSRAFVHLLEQVVATPNARLSELTILDDRQRRQLLVDWNNTAVPYPTEPCLHQLFESQVNRTPDALAIVFEEHSLTYAQLNDRANQLAHYLRAQGVGPDTCVGLCLERSLEMVIGLYAVLKAGGGYVPLDPDYPGERIAFILADTAATLVLTQQHLHKVLNKTSIARFDLDSDWQRITHYPETNPVKCTSAANLAYVIYTSGSTGQPKGVAVAHRGVCDRMRWTQERYPLNAQDSVLLKTPFSFDVSVCEFFWPLIAGARLVITQPEGHKDPVYLSRIIDQHQVTTVHFVPSMLQAFLDQLTNESGRSLTRIICSGEALALDLQQRCLEQLHAKLHNLYGPTEASIHVTAWECQPETPYSSVPMGRPLANTDVYVLDRYLNPVPVGVPGEFYIGGTGVARGYLNRPTLTARSFVPHPYSDKPGARLYKTGDLVRYLADGNLEYLGRLDHQVKLRGFRIELGEIEAALRQHPSVKEAAVLLREDKPGQQRLAAYIAWQSETTTAETHALKRFLQNHLPDYMLPTSYTAVATMPLTPTGKLDRKALPAPGTENSRQEYVAPRTPAEEMLAGIWKDVLKIERVGIYDNFFELGGHSLLATQVISRIRQSFNADLPVKVLFTLPTIESLTDHIIHAKDGVHDYLVPKIEPAPRTSSLPLSFSQQRFWFLNQIIPDNPFFNMPGALRLEGNLSISALRDTFNILIKRHEGLRTCFPMGVDGQPKQVIHSNLKIEAPLIDLSGLTQTLTSKAVQKYLGEETKLPFNLASGPLIRVRLLRLSSTKHILLFTLHHIICDGWSLGILRREFEDIYNKLTNNKPVNLPRLPLQYADFAAWQHTWLQGKTLENQLSYWHEQLDGMPPLLQLATDRVRPKVQTFNGAVEPISINKELANALIDISKSNDSTLFMVLMTAFNILLYRHSGQTDFAVGTIIANRHYAELESIVGVFINTMPLRADLSGDPTFIELLQQTKKSALDAYAHQDIPFELLVEKIQPERTTAYTPLYQVLFVLQNTPLDTGKSKNELNISAMESPRTVAEHDLTLNLSESHNGVTGILEYNTDLFNKYTMKNMVNHLLLILEQVATDADILLSRIDILSREEQHAIDCWNSTSVPLPNNDSLHQLFETQAHRTPDAVAVVCGEQSVSYSELNKKTNQLSRYLIDQGIGPGHLVGVCLERSLDMVIALIGILKTGGAYVPLDPEYPQERLRFILEDTAAPFVITRQAYLEILPATSLNTLCLNGYWNNINNYPETNPSTAVPPFSLAYTIYTSGSTGRPKGVAITHQGICNRLRWMQGYYQLNATDRVLQKTPFSFDVSVWEFFWPLMAGARLILAKPEGHKDARYLGQLIDTQKITTVHFVPSMLQAFLEQLPQNSGRTLQRVICSGEELPTELQHHFFTRLNAQLYNLYGPTEASIDVTVWACQPDDASARIPIGKPIANTETYVLDQHLNPTPIGVPGELFLSGVGLAQSYINRPSLTAQAFIPHPFGKQPGARLYKTGDRARFLTDGNIEFLGRIDHQVKLRGYRIELGEIESMLRQHPAVLEAAVLLREDNPGDQRLAAYVVPDAEYTPDKETKSTLNKKAINQWKTVYDETYQISAPETEPFFNISGWNSSYTAQPIPAEQMREWVEDTVELIKGLKPNRILEIGCGTGLLLGRLLPLCEEYVGIDLSEKALNQIKDDLLRTKVAAEKLTLLQGRADDLNIVTGKTFDTIILNSVVICFPSVDYLVNVIQDTLKLLAPGGKLFIGDVRHLGLLEAFHTSVQLYRSSNTLTKSELTQLIHSNAANDKDLVVDPKFFIALQQNTPRLNHVQIVPKLSRFHNEMSLFRYDVILYSEENLSLHNDIAWQSWEDEHLNVKQISTYLEENRPDTLALLSVPNLRLVNTINSLNLLNSADNELATLADIRRHSTDERNLGVDPYELMKIANTLSYDTEFSWVSSDREGRYDVVFQRKGDQRNNLRLLSLFSSLKLKTPAIWKNYANNPQFLVLKTNLLPSIRQHLSNVLPDYMVPSAIVFLDTFPLTVNGKLDRKALPETGSKREDFNIAYVPPATEMEQIVSEIWGRLLGISNVGRNDNFFQLGGHSLLATRFVSHVREHLNIEFPLVTLFETPVLKAISTRLEYLGSTVDGIEHITSNASTNQWTPLVSLQPHGAKPPIFCIHPADGSVVVYMKLATQLGTEHPFYGIQARGLEPRQDPITSMDEMVTQYLNEIKAVQPKGPYCLAGWSGGGHIALEMAQRLVASREEEVRSLFIIDTPAIMRISLSDDVSYFTSIFKTGITKPEDELRSLSTNEFIKEFAARAQKGLLLSNEYSIDDAKRLFNVFKANMDISNSYVPARYNGSITFFAATTERGGSNSIDLSIPWKDRINQNTNVFYIPGDHSSIIKQTENARIIAQHMAKQLKENF